MGDEAEKKPTEGTTAPAAPATTEAPKDAAAPDAAKPDAAKPEGTKPDVSTPEKAESWIAQKYKEYLKTVKEADINKDGKPDLDQFEDWIKKQTDGAAELYQEAKTKITSTGRQVLDVMTDSARSVDDSTGNFFSKNGWGLGLGALGLIAGMLMGGEMAMILGLLLAVAGFVLGGAMMDKDGMFGGLFGGKKQEPSQQQATGKGLVKELDTPTVPTHENGLVQVIQKDKDGNISALNGVDEKGNPTFGPAAAIKLPIYDGNHKIMGYAAGKVNGSNFDVTDYIPLVQDGSKDGVMLNPIKLEKPLQLQVNSQGKIDLKSPALDDIKKHGESAKSEYIATTAYDLGKISERDVSVTLKGTDGKDASVTHDGKEYSVAMLGVKSLGKDNKQIATFDRAVLVDKATGEPLRGPDGGPVQVSVPQQSYTLTQDGKVNIMNGQAKNLVDDIGIHVTTKHKELVETKKKVDAAELKAITEGINGTKSIKEANGSLQVSLSQFLESKEMGLQTPELALPRAMATSGIIEAYNRPDFLKKSAEDAAREIANLDEVKKLGPKATEAITSYIQRNHEGIAHSMESKVASAPQEDVKPEGPAQTPAQTKKPPQPGAPEQGNGVFI